MKILFMFAGILARLTVLPLLMVIGNFEQIAEAEELC